MGDVSDATFEVEALLRSMNVGGNLANSTIEARMLRRVFVRGQITGDGLTNEIRARSGRFFARDSTWHGWIDDGTRFGHRWFPSDIAPNRLRAWVG